MTDKSTIHRHSDLNRFAAEQWDRALAFLQHRYGIAEDDCKDLFQEAFIVLYDNIHAGKLDSMTASLSTYFLSICRFKALEFMRSSGKSVNVDSEMSLSLMEGDLLMDRIDSLIALDGGDDAVEQRKQELVHTIVTNMPSPCNELLWGVYRDNLTMKVLAEMLKYSSEAVAKVTKHRCCEKFRKRYNELCNKLF